MAVTNGNRAEDVGTEKRVGSLQGRVNAEGARQSSIKGEVPTAELRTSGEAGTGQRAETSRAIGRGGFILAHMLAGMSLGGLIAVLGFGLLLVPGLVVGALAGAGTGLARWSRRRDRAALRSGPSR